MTSTVAGVAMAAATPDHSSHPSNAEAAHSATPLPEPGGGSGTNKEGTLQAVSMAGQARLLEMTYQRLHTSIMVLPLVALALTLFYGMHHDARWMWWWMGFYVVFATASFTLRRAFRREQAQLAPEALMQRWRPRLEACALLHGAGTTAPVFIVAGHASYDFALLLLVTNAAIVAGNATHQTPVLSVFMRFFMAGWNAALLAQPWLFPDRWFFILPLSLLHTFTIYRHSRTAHRFFVHQTWLEERGQQLSAQYREARDVAQAALAEKNRFLSTAAHDLRQPVHAMGLLTEAIALRNRDEALAAPLSDLRLNLQSVQLMFNSLLDLSKIESGQLAAWPEPLALARLFGELEIQFQAEARSRGLRLRVHRPPAGAMVQADAALLRQSLSNLVHNALRYTRQGGVLIGARGRRGEWRIEVWDTGMGVALQERTQIYQPFYRPQHAWHINKEGHGLGLAVVARCVALMGAQHGLQSRLGAGSCFWLQLPAAARPVDAKGGGATDAPAPPPSHLLQGRCLVLDDDPHVLSAWTALLGSWGLEVCLASDAQQAFAHVESGPPIDVVLCDQRLRSGESGFDVLKALLARRPSARGAMVSGEFDAPQLRLAEDEGYLVLKKPVDMSELHLLLTRWLAPDPVPDGRLAQ
ncbi:hybrid sensor histidine kinase/response regulator [Paracidovorax sp. MALMAid1276]|uniref:ATP-binding response regulator n=1 Tax=Paracidovorax sp. MALMAid1276 TaxID=3411631 RepID=UPI003B9CCA7F